MRNIEVGILQEPANAEKMSIFLARLTQRGHQISSLDDLYELFEKPVKNPQLRLNLSGLEHGTIKRFDSYTVAIIGASRRFLAQIRTHQHADFVSGSLQYSDWSDINRVNDWQKMFVVPYEFMKDPTAQNKYLRACGSAYGTYQTLARVDNDAAGFIMPNGLRNVLIIQANVQQWQYMIKLRTCRRNSDETRYTMLKIWDELLTSEYGQDFFDPSICGPSCMNDKCHEGKFCCGERMPQQYPSEILQTDYPLCFEDTD